MIVKNLKGCYYVVLLFYGVPKTFLIFGESEFIRVPLAKLCLCSCIEDRTRDISFTMQNYNKYFISQTIFLKKCKKSSFCKADFTKQGMFFAN